MNSICSFGGLRTSSCSFIKPNGRRGTDYIHSKDYYITGRANGIFCAVVFAKFLSKMKENFKYSVSIMDTALTQKFPFILDRNLAKGNCTENQVFTSCDIVVLDS